MEGWADLIQMNMFVDEQKQDGVTPDPARRRRLISPSEFPIVPDIRSGTSRQARAPAATAERGGWASGVAGRDVRKQRSNGCCLGLWPLSPCGSRRA
jgi:hypothetical protein